MKARLELDCRNLHGEGVTWSAEHGLLYWTDIHGQSVWTYAPATHESRSHMVPGRLCCLAPRAGRGPQEVVAAFEDGFAFLDLGSARRSEIASFETDRPSTRLNDGRTDRQGRFIAGGMDEERLAPISSVMRLDPDLTLVTLIEGVGCANSTCFSPDGRTMYFADSPTREIVAYDYDPDTGGLGARRSFARLEGEGVPDGSCIDSEGCLWNAVWEGYRVERRRPDGTLDRVIEVPVKKPTCCAFGGADLATLYITSSRLGESPEDLSREPQAGGLFAIETGFRGLADSPFAG